MIPENIYSCYKEAKDASWFVSSDSQFSLFIVKIVLVLYKNNISYVLCSGHEEYFFSKEFDSTAYPMSLSVFLDILNMETVSKSYFEKNGFSSFENHCYPKS